MYVTDILENVSDDCGLYYVLNDELLNGLGHTLGVISSAYRLHVAITLFWHDYFYILVLHQDEGPVREGI